MNREWILLSLHDTGYNLDGYYYFISSQISFIVTVLLKFLQHVPPVLYKLPPEKLRFFRLKKFCYFSPLRRDSPELCRAMEESIYFKINFYTSV